jgi:hypothetical protein
MAAAVTAAISGTAEARRARVIHRRTPRRSAKRRSASTSTALAAGGCGGYSESVVARKLSSASILAGWAALCIWLAFIPETGVQAFFGSLGAIYLAACLGVMFRWFWARWFAIGVGWWGAMAGGSLMLMTGISSFLVAFTLSHFAVVVLLHGPAVVGAYEGRSDWREKYRLDERGVARIGGLVTNLGTLLPFAAFYAFFPRGTDTAAPVAALLLGLGTLAVLRMRTWGLFAIAAGGITLASAAGDGVVGLGTILVGALLALSVARFVPDIARFLLPRH